MTNKKLWANINDFFITQPNDGHDAPDIQLLRQHVKQLGTPYVEEQSRVNLTAAQKRWRLYAKPLSQLSTTLTTQHETSDNKSPT